MTGPATTENARREYVRGLASAIDARSGHNLAPHVAYRVTAVLYPQPWVFIDAITAQDTAQKEPRRLKGFAVIYTDRVLAMVEYSGVRDVTSITVGHEPTHEGSTVEVTVIGRSRLRELSLPSADNAGVPWQQAAKDEASFSRHSLMTLRYDGVTTPLKLPLSRAAAEDMGSLIEGFARDLNA